MHEIFTIKELLQHILNFIPRKLIMPCAFTCKSFYYAIAIDYNQDTVAKNSDMFSLLKIPYSSKAVVNIAAQYNNIDMVNYLINKNIALLDDSELCQMIGYVGDEDLITQMPTKNIAHAMIGICEGLHIELFEKYKTHDFYNYDMTMAVYKNDCVDMQDRVNEFLDNGRNYYYDIDLKGAKINGNCARKNANDVLKFIQNLIDTNIFSDDTDYIEYACDGLIEGGHHDIFVWFQEQITNIDDNYMYTCENDMLIECLIKNNNYDMFTYILANNCVRKGYYDGRYRIIIDNYGLHTLNFRKLAVCCIDYRRVHMLTFLIEYIEFNLVHHQEFLDKAYLLKFYDIVQVLVLNSHLFKEYNEC